MELSWLETFIALAEYGSIRTTAAHLDISPSTLSDRISVLEQYLGVKLFQRGALGSVLTEQGKIYLKESKKILEEWSNISTTVSTMDKNQSSFLRLAFQGQSIPPIVGQFLDYFMELNSGVTLSFFNDQEFGIDDGLAGGKIDAYFAYCPQNSSCVGRVQRPVFRTRLCALVPARHRLAWKKEISLKELDGEKFLVYPATKETSLRNREIEALRASGIRYTLYEGHLSPSFYMLLVQMGCGIAICPLALSRSIPPQTSLLQLTDPLCRCSIDMLYNPENSNPVLLTFLKEFGDMTGEDNI